ncbi:hypothetical protein [Rhodopila sp.]|uniref:hypothetical protein n=1 Tax=Rhodopila sp. TaxID=2480087 RepID=UPI003D136E6A
MFISTEYVDGEARGAVRQRFRRRALVAAIGVGLAALSATLAILGKWASFNGMVETSVICFIVTLAWGVGVTVETVREIR